MVCPPPLRNKALVELIFSLADFAILTMIARLWARRSKLDLGFSGPAYGRAELSHITSAVAAPA